MTEQEAYTELNRKLRGAVRAEFTTRYTAVDFVGRPLYRICVWFTGDCQLISAQEASLESAVRNLIVQATPTRLASIPSPGTQIVAAYKRYRDPTASMTDEQFAAAIDAALKSNSEPC